MAEGSGPEMTIRQFAGMASGVFALAAAFLPHNVGAATAEVVTGAVVGRSVARQSSAPRHLYVLDGGNAVFRFPLAQDGLPAMQPDSVLYPEGARDLTGLAVDRVGHVFVADGDKGTVSEFAAGATGQQLPISVLNLGDDPDRLNIDDFERLYVHLGTNQDIAIFAKGAHGNDAPISIVPLFPQAFFITDYVIATTGALYALNWGGPVAVFDDPLNNPLQPDRLISADGNFYTFKTTLALDDATDQLYIEFDPGTEKYWNKVSYDVRSASSNNAPFTHIPWIFTGACGQATSVNGTKVIKNYLIVSCNYNPGVVSVYRKEEFGRQRAPVEIVGQGTLCCPFEMAVGP
jgi:hypothetical protein